METIRIESAITIEIELHSEVTIKQRIESRISKFIEMISPILTKWRFTSKIKDHG